MVSQQILAYCLAAFKYALFIQGYIYQMIIQIGNAREDEKVCLAEREFGLRLIIVGILRRYHKLIIKFHLLCP